MRYVLTTILSLLFPALPVAAQDWALRGYDVVEISSGRPLEGRGDIATMWKGKLWHFHSEENRNMFEADPRKFAPAFGGLCPVSLAHGRQIKGDPRFAVVLNRKLYLVRSRAEMRELTDKQDDVLPLAERNWAALR